MSEVELMLVSEGKNCTLYTIQFVSEDCSEFEKFYAKFKDDVEYNPDLMIITDDEESLKQTVNELANREL